jgi:alpha-galactosidase
MGSMVKVVIIGGGSMNFAGGLTRDILSYEATCDTEFVYVDIDPRRLDLGVQFAKRVLREGRHDKASVRGTLDRRGALEGADYVIISILVGGYDAIMKEIDIPAKYGINQCIGDTLTPGGIMRCLRTLPVFIEIAADVREICPNAVVLNYTNPMGMLSWGFQDAATEVQYVGLCHSVQGTAGEWAHRLGVAKKDVNYECAGINHEAWFTRFEVNGEDMLPRIRELAQDPKIWSGDSTRMELIKHFGYPVTESSGHVSEYNWWFRKNDETIRQYCDDENAPWNGGPGFIKKLYARPDWEEQMQRRINDPEPLKLERSVEYGSRIIHAIETGETELIYGNVKNHGLITNLPYDAVVEVPIHVDRNGMQPVRVGALPPHLAAINRAQLAVQELAVRAVQERNPERVFQAMALDPLTAMSCTLDQIRAMTRELMEAHRPYIPVFEGRLPSDRKVMYTLKQTDKEIHVDPGEAGTI